MKIGVNPFCNTDEISDIHVNVGTITSPPSGYRILSIGVDPGYSFELGSRNEIHEKVGIGTESAVKKIQPFVQTIMKKS